MLTVKKLKGRLLKQRKKEDFAEKTPILDRDGIHATTFFSIIISIQTKWVPAVKGRLTRKIKSQGRRTYRSQKCATIRQQIFRGKKTTK